LAFLILTANGGCPQGPHSAAISWIGLAILLIGKRSIHGLRYVEEKGANPLPQ
jgi:hypothetical protein